MFANTVPSGNNNTIPLEDSPKATTHWYNQIDAEIRFNFSATDYLMFQPDGGIWVPLGKTATPWSVNCNVEWPTLDISSQDKVSGPGDLDSSIGFPSWEHTLATH